MATIVERGKRWARRFASPRVFAALHDVPFAAVDLVTGHWNGEPTCPPLRLMRDGPRGRDQFRSGGEGVVPFYRDVLGVEPDHTILDVGCGIGRKTIPLLDYLDDEGRYIGMDTDAKLVDWCVRNISTRNPRFAFIPVSVHNSFYNPRGAITPERFVWPFPDGSFDNVVAWSVFTHLLPATIEHYLAEASRVLSPGGSLGASFFVMDDETHAAVETGRSLYPVAHRLDGYWTSNPTMPEDLIAVDHDWLLGAIERSGLVLKELRRGSWTGREVDPTHADLSVQDVVVAQRPAVDPVR